MTRFLLIDKPAGITSHDVVNQVRKITGEQRVGHAGTLDPFATGLLIVAVGRENTKKLNELVGLDKEYEAVFVLGARSETDDIEGPVISDPNAHEVSRQEIKTVIKKFIGQIDQVPPKYAAIKVKGRKLYEAARAGEEIERKPRSVRIDEFELLHILPKNKIKVRIKCGSGTYIRALARDLGDELGIGGYVEQLRRTKIGSFDIKDAVPLNEL
ncbi:MAG: tRNA pseudouridine(55) synthase TruB [Candidatus Uhrbacteria bacterium]